MKLNDVYNKLPMSKKGITIDELEYKLNLSNTAVLMYLDELFDLGLVGIDIPRPGKIKIYYKKYNSKIDLTKMESK